VARAAGRLKDCEGLTVGRGAIHDFRRVEKAGPRRSVHARAAAAGGTHKAGELT